MNALRRYVTMLDGAAAPPAHSVPCSGSAAQVGHESDTQCSAIADSCRDGGAAPADWKVELQDFTVARTRVGVEIPNVAWADIGGLEDVKQRLREAVEWPTTHAEALHRVGAKPPRGVLLYGPPGCSKTMLARAVASESKLNFLSVKGPELFSKWVGESEKAVKALFRRARAAAPAVVFFDEMDALASTREEGSGAGASSSSERVLNQLLTEMDGLQPLLGVSVVAATNRPDLIDPALLRPGRFDRLLYVGPPTGTSNRADIFRVHLKRTPLAEDVVLEDLAELAAGYTGADVTAVCRE
eukprot:gene11339-13400_t